MIFVVFLSCLAVVLAAPQGAPSPPIAIISQESSQDPNGGYKYKFETENGIKGEEVGTVKKTAEAEVVVAQGSFSYTAPDGTVISLSYTADDENGFAPKGDHLPTPPPIPPAIQKALEFLASLPPPAPKRQ